MKLQKRVEWNQDKNKFIKETRGISFEEVVVAIEEGHLLDIMQNPSERYTNQRVYVIELNQLVVLVPFVEDDEKIFLKTAFPSRKMAKQYKRGR